MQCYSWANFAAMSASNSLQQIPAYFAGMAAEQLLGSTQNTPIKFLDVAAGQGTLAANVISFASSKLISINNVHVTDLSASSVEKAKAQLSTADGVDKAFSEMNAEHMDFMNGQFSHVGCMFGVMFFTNRDKGLREMYRVLHPGGSVVIGTWKSVGTIAITADFCKYLSVSNLESNLAELEAMILSCGDTDRFEQELRDVGFVDVSTTVEDKTFHLLNDSKTYMACTSNEIIRKLFNGQDPAELYPKWQEFLLSPIGARWLDKEGKVMLRFVAGIVVAAK